MTIYTPRSEGITGADLTGSDGDLNRTYTLANSDSILAQMQLLVAEAILQDQINFTFNSITGTLTFLGKVWDNQDIQIDYFTTDTVATSGSTSYTPRHENITGIGLTGADGAVNRTYNLIHDGSILNQMQLIVAEAILQESLNFTFDAANGVVTFLGKVWNSQAISLDYFIDEGVTPSDFGDYYSNTLQIVRFSGIGVEIFSESLGVGDGIKGDYDLAKGNVIAGSYKIRCVATGSNLLQTLIETTDYTMLKDHGLIQLTASGITKVDGLNIYADYTYSPKQSDTVLASYLPAATKEAETLTANYYGTAKTSIEYFDGYDSGYPQTDEPYGTQIDNIPEFELPYQGINSITTVEFLDKTGSVDTTVDANYISADEDGRVILNAQSIPNGKRNIKITFVHGYTTVPDQVQELTALIAGTMALVNISGGSYKSVSTYQLGRLNFSLGQIYVNISASIAEMKKRIDTIVEDLGYRFACA